MVRVASIIVILVAALASPLPTVGIQQLRDSFTRIRVSGVPPPDFFVERGGEFVLPPKVRAALQLLREYRLERFRYSAGIANDPDPALLQRLAEGTYPIRLDARAKHVLFLRDEAPDPGCIKVAEQDGVVLGYCS